MQFWSKGLGKKTIQLFLSKGESVEGTDFLYLQGQMEAPVDWEYIMPMSGPDLVDFFDLLREPSIAEYVHQSPNRWKLYGAMIVQGLALAGKVAVVALQYALGRIEAPESVAIQVPPPSVMKKKRKKAAVTKQKPYRRRLGSKTTSAPSLTSAMREQKSEAEVEVEEAIQDAMQAASEIASA
jgi:hypothetical protein